MTIQCYDKNCQLVGLVEDFTNLRFCRKFSGIGDWELNIDGTNVLEISYLINSQFIRLGKGLAGIITQITEKKDDAEYSYCIAGTELKGIANKRIVIPPSGQEKYTLKDKSPEYIIASLLDTQLLAPTNANRTISGELAQYTESATRIDLEAKYTAVSAEIEKIAEANQVGWYADIEDGQIIWYIHHGIDRTRRQNINEPLLLGFEFDVLQSLNYSINTQPQKNSAYVLGNGEGASRPSVIVNDSNSGLDRNELYVDARNAEDSQLAQEGQEQLGTYGDDITVRVKPIQPARKYYRTIYDVGDYGTLVEQDVDLQLTEAQSIWENNEYKLELTFGYDGANMSSALRHYTANFLSCVENDPILRG